jgi:hypothetical protein
LCSLVAEIFALLEGYKGKAGPVLYAAVAFASEKEPPVPIGEKAGWTSETFWKLWRRENFCPAEN